MKRLIQNTKNGNEVFVSVINNGDIMNKQQVLQELATLNAKYEIAKEALGAYKRQYEFIRDKLVDYIQNQ